MATSKKLVITVNTSLGKTKAFNIKNPKAGLTRSNASAFTDKLYEDDILDPNSVGTAGELLKAYYEETVITDLA